MRTDPLMHVNRRLSNALGLREGLRLTCARVYRDRREPHLVAGGNADVVHYFPGDGASGPMIRAFPPEPKFPS